MSAPLPDADVSDGGGFPPAVQPYVIPRVARQQARLLVLQVGIVLGAAAAVVLGTHATGWSLLGVVVVLIVLFASFASQDLFLATIGADGLLLCRRGGESFFVAYTDLAGCELQAEGGMVLVLREGASVPVLDDPSRNRQGLVTVSVQRQRILAARSRCLGAPMDPPHAQALDRGAHTLDTWVDALHGLARPDTGAYRSNTLSASLLWQVAEDARVVAVHRVAAVVALSPALDTDGRKRLQRLWGATANPYLQEAIATAQEGRYSALREVLDAVDRLPRRGSHAGSVVRVAVEASAPPSSEADALPVRAPIEETRRSGL